MTKKNEVAEVTKDIVKKNKGGRPCKYNKESLNKIIDEYIEEYKTNGSTKIPTKIAFLNKAGICRDVYNRYKKLPEFKDALKRLENYLETEITLALLDKEKTNAGIIFYLKNAFGWRDKQEVSHTIEAITLPTNGLTGDTKKIEG